MELSVRKLGNSTGIILPPGLLRSLHLSVGSTVSAKEVEGSLVLTPSTKLRYSLTELLAQCNLKADAPADSAVWESMETVGKEIA
jgi:antitoxin ChpS